MPITREHMVALVRNAWPGATTEQCAALADEHMASISEPDAGAITVCAIGPRAVFLAQEGRRAWVYGTLTRDAVTGPIETAWPPRDPAIGRVFVGGPPGDYLRGGLASDDLDAIAWFTEQGFVVRARHVDLHATLRAAGEVDARVRRATREEERPLTEWVRATFSHGWAREVRRALAHREAVFVRGVPGAYEGFAAHSGNNAALGTFGPIGVETGSRRGGLGQALARAALDDLHARGHRTATIPWVDPALERFYRPLVEDITVQPRVLLAWG